jgi:hypothetical protein
VRRGDDLIAIAHFGKHVEQPPLPQRVLIQFHFVNQDDGPVNVLGHEADEQQENHLLAATETIVAVLVCSVAEADVELVEFVANCPNDLARGADFSIPLLNERERRWRLPFRTLGCNQRPERKGNQDGASVGRFPLVLLRGGSGGAVDDVPHLTGDVLGQSRSFLIKGEDTSNPLKPLPPESPSRQEPSRMDATFQKKFTWGGKKHRA